MIGIACYFQPCLIERLWRSVTGRLVTYAQFLSPWPPYFFLVTINCRRYTITVLVLRLFLRLSSMSRVCKPRRGCHRIVRYELLYATIASFVRFHTNRRPLYRVCRPRRGRHRSRPCVVRHRSLFSVSHRSPSISSVYGPAAAATESFRRASSCTYRSLRLAVWSYTDHRRFSRVPTRRTRTLRHRMCRKVSH